MADSLNIIVLADDPLARAGLSALLAGMPEVAVVEQGSSDLLAEAAAGLSDEVVDLVVWDTGWGDEPFLPDEPLEADVPVLALVVDEEAAAAVWRAGCRGILSRDFEENQLAAAMQAVACGLVVLSPSLAAAAGPDRSVPAPAPTELTPREMEVLILMAEGMTNKAIANALFISDHTVKFHVNAILSKLDAQSRTDAVVRASRLGLIAL